MAVQCRATRVGEFVGRGPGVVGAGGADGETAGSAIVWRTSLRLGRIKDLSLVSRVAVAVDDAGDRLYGEKRGEIAANLGWRGNRGQLRQCLANTEAFVVSEKEQFVLDDGPAQRKAELVLLVGLLTEDVEVIAGVHFLVAQKLPQVAVDLVGAGLDDGIHDGAVAAAEFGAVGIGLDFEFGDGIHRRLDDISGAVEDVAQIRIVVDAVEQKVILQRAGAVGAEAIGGFDARSGFGGSNARAKQERVAHSCVRSKEAR